MIIICVKAAPVGIKTRIFSHSHVKSTARPSCGAKSQQKGDFSAQPGWAESTHGLMGTKFLILGQFLLSKTPLSPDGIEVAPVRSVWPREDKRVLNKFPPLVN